MLRHRRPVDLPTSLGAPHLLAYLAEVGMSTCRVSLNRYRHS